jgi:hypothetical protein
MILNDAPRARIDITDSLSRRLMDKQIDALVYKLYDLNDERIKIVEGV